LANKINIRWTPKRQKNHGNAVLKNDELCSALQLERSPCLIPSMP
jgi:hypothetical protein